MRRGSASVARVVSGALLLIALEGLPAPAADSPPDARALSGHVKDYTFMWWTHGLRDERKVFSIQTSRYTLQFDVPAFQLTHLTPLKTALPEAAVLVQKGDAVFGAPDASLACTLRSGGDVFAAAGASRNIEDSHLVESGRFFQRRTVNKIAWAKGAPAAEGSLEIAAWPDRLAILLRVTPSQAVAGGALEMTLAAGGEFGVAADPPEAGPAREPGKNRWTVRLPARDWPAGEERTVALLLQPGAEPEEEPPVVVKAAQTAPAPAALEVTYDRVLGWHRVDLRNDGNVADYAESSNGRIERVALTLENPSPAPRTVRLCFAKGLPGKGGVFGITGLSALLRDPSGNPTGIPVQISKNWHNGKKPERYQGPWYRGLTMLSIPAGAKVELEYVSVNALWGGIPAASHAQLCLVGWGNNQLWDQSAIGSWGESLCYEPDQGQVGGAVLDTRPLMVSGMGKEPKRKWGWTCNVGGADFLVFYGPDGKKQWHSAMKARYRRVGPVLTEVTYAGRTHDGAIDLQYTVSLHRTDDITRGLYRFRYDVRQPAPFGRLVLFQSGGDDYSYTGERTFAVGSEAGLAKEWATQRGGNAYRTAPAMLAGRVPWLSMHEAVPRAEGKEAWANRGIVIRQWDATLGGKKAAPWVAERGAKVRGADTSLFDILPPPSVKALQPGDAVEAVVEHVIVPQFADDYYGPNANLKAALEKGQNTWRMIHREALGNDLEVGVTKGKLLRRIPTLVQAQGNQAEFTIAGGLGCVPVTIAGLSGWRDPVLELQEGGAWKAVDQSVHGKDFWQTDFNAEEGSLEITYSVPLDSPGDARVRRAFRFRMP